ncbi:MAG: hypothetical protein WC830_01190 [Burkholderiales bacterium]|jgi:hypothetical protein
MGPRIAALAAVVLAACATATTFSYTHRGQNLGHIDYKGRKVAAVVTGVGVTESRRVNAENVLAKELTARGMEGVAGHSIVPSGTPTPITRERAIVLLRQADVAGVVALRLVDTERKTARTEWASTEMGTSVPQSDYNFFPIGLEGDTYDRRITTITIETTLFNLEPFALLWAGQSESVSPAKVDTFIPRFARSVAEELRREGLIE